MWTGRPPTPAQECLDELALWAAQATQDLAAPPSADVPPAPLPPLRLAAALLEGGLVLACPPLHRGGAAGSWFRQLTQGTGRLPGDAGCLLTAASLCPMLGSEGRARLAPHVLAAAPLVLWGAASGAPSVSRRSTASSTLVCCRAFALLTLCGLLSARCAMTQLLRRWKTMGPSRVPVHRRQAWRTTTLLRARLPPCRS